MLDLGTVNGKRVRRFCDTREQAELALRAAKIESREMGNLALDLSTDERIEFAQLSQKLKAANATLREAVEFYLRHHQTQASCLTLAAAFEQFSSGLERKKRSPRYIYDMQRIFALFLEDTKATKFSEVTPEAIEGWVGNNRLSVGSKRHRLAAIRPFFLWAKKRRMISDNPCESALFEFGDTRKAEPLAFGVSDCRKMLRVCSESFPELLGYLATGLFLGVRPEEAARLPLEMLSLENGTLFIPAQIAKARRRRVIELNETAREWLSLWGELCPEATGLRPLGYQRRWNRFRESAGVADRWIHDGLRHTFATMHYAAFQDVAKVKAIMGHSNSDQVLFDHYRAVQTNFGETVTRAMAEEFWSLTPKRVRGR